MKIREFRPSDIEAIDRIWRAHYNDVTLPDRRNAVIDAVVESREGGVVGYGQVKLFAEAMLFLDKDASQRNKAQALKLLMLEAIRGTDNAGLKSLYCFIRDPEFATLISKHYGFDIVDAPGELLLREV